MPNRIALGLAALAGLGLAAWWKGRAAVVPDSGDSIERGIGGSVGSQPSLYSPARLSGGQQYMADLIVLQATEARINPAFMLALAVIYAAPFNLTGALLCFPLAGAGCVCHSLGRPDEHYF